LKFDGLTKLLTPIMLTGVLAAFPDHIGWLKHDLL